MPRSTPAPWAAPAGAVTRHTATESLSAPRSFITRPDALYLAARDVRPKPPHVYSGICGHVVGKIEMARESVTDESVAGYMTQAADLAMKFNDHAAELNRFCKMTVAVLIGSSLLNFVLLFRIDRHPNWKRLAKG